MIFGSSALFAALLPLALFQEAAAQVDTPSIQPVELSLEMLARALPEGSVPDTPILIPAIEVRRQLIYQFGRAELESRKLDVFINDEINSQLAAGVPPEQFGIPKSEIDAAIAETLEKVKEQYPDLKPEAVLQINGVDTRNLPSLTRQSKLFDLVFLPDNPNDWPPLTTEALMERMGEEFVSQTKSSYEGRSALEAEQTPEERAQAQGSLGMFNHLIRTQVRAALNDAATIETASNGLPAEIVMRVNGTDVLTEELFEQVSSKLTESDVAEVEALLIKNKLVEQALRAKDAWLEGEEWEMAWESHVEENANSIFPLETIAVLLRGFPSLEIYSEYYRLASSFERMVSADITDETLGKHVDERAGHIINLAEVESEIILISAFDFPNNRWIEGGWEAAGEEALAVVDELAAMEGKNWDELLVKHSDFWDPPAPTTPVAQDPAQQKRKNKGRFGRRNRNTLLQMLGESDFTTYLRGSSIVDEIFFHMEAGEVGGPFLGEHGYYIVRVLDRTPPRSTRDLRDEDFKTMVLQDFVTDGLTKFADDLYQAAVSG